MTYEAYHRYHYQHHCCVCSGVCHHVGPPMYCARHDPNNYMWKTPAPKIVVVPATDTWQQIQPLVISENDVDRIARRVVELLDRVKNQDKDQGGNQ